MLLGSLKTLYTASGLHEELRTTPKKKSTTNCKIKANILHISMNLLTTISYTPVHSSGYPPQQTNATLLIIKVVVSRIIVIKTKHIKSFLIFASQVVGESDNVRVYHLMTRMNNSFISDALSLKQHDCNFSSNLPIILMIFDGSLHSQFRLVNIIACRLLIGWA